MIILISSNSYDGNIFHIHADSKNGHYQTTLANIEGSPLAVGGYGPSINKAETYDIETNTWTEVTDYPYHDRYVFIPPENSDSQSVVDFKICSAFTFMQRSQPEKELL